jgi:hypothetical protein
MTRTFALMAATAALAVAPVTAQAAAPSRVATPVTAESEDLRGSPVVVPIVVALIVAAIILAVGGGKNPTSP